MKVKQTAIGQFFLFQLDTCKDISKLEPKAEKEKKETDFTKEIEELAKKTVESLSDEQVKEVAEVFRKSEEKAKPFSEIMKPYIGKKGCEIWPLCSLPASDGNFKGSMDKASVEDLRTALELMEKYPKGHSGRISAIKSRLRKLGESTITETGFSIIRNGFYDKWNKKGIADYGCTVSPEFNEFIKDLKKVIQALAEKNEWELVEYKKGHYFLFGFMKSKEDRYVYFSYDVPRGEYPLQLSRSGVDGFLIRGAKNVKDYTGFGNHFCNLSGLESMIENCMQIQQE